MRIVSSRKVTKLSMNGGAVSHQLMNAGGGGVREGDNE
jgi:hypothetical protein